MQKKNEKHFVGNQPWLIEKKNELKCNFFTNSRFEMDSQVYAISKDIMEGPGEGLFDHIAQCLAVFAKGKFCFFV